MEREGKGEGEVGDSLYPWAKIRSIDPPLPSCSR